MILPSNRHSFLSDRSQTLRIWITHELHRLRDKFLLYVFKILVRSPTVPRAQLQDIDKPNDILVITSQTLRIWTTHVTDPVVQIGFLKTSRFLQTSTAV